ncbi:MAG: cellulose binding domain-containing protein, partial [Planctomycetia bacterium]|nr:cellulose binding domain-containing protein [Planctomycetia bacterium]
MKTTSRSDNSVAGIIGSRRSNRNSASANRGSQGRHATLAAFDQLESRIAFSVSYGNVNDWGTGVQGQLTLTNDTSAAIADWQVSVNYSRTID